MSICLEGAKKNVLEAWHVTKRLDGTEKKVSERALQIIRYILPYLFFLIVYKPLKAIKERIVSKKYAQPIGRDNTLGFPKPIDGYNYVGDSNEYKYKNFLGIT